MSLVPFSPSSPVAPPSPSAASRASLPSARGAATPGAPRAPSTVHRESAPAASAKNKAGFAIVLAAAQDHGDAAPAAPVESHAATALTTGPGERVTEVAESPEAPLLSPGATSPADAPLQAQAPTPWLLLALSSGSRSWQDGGDAASIDTGTEPVIEAAMEAVTEQDPVVALAPSQPQPEPTSLLIGASVVVPAAAGLAAPAVPTPPEGTTRLAVPTLSAGVEGPGTAGPAVPEIAASVVSGAASPNAFGPLSVPLVVKTGGEPMRPGQVSDVADQLSQDGRRVADEATTSASPPTMEMLARWRVASRATGGVTESMVPSITEIPPGASTGAAAGASPAASRLAQWMGQLASAEADVAAVLPGLAMEGAVLAAGALSAPRASEVLARLSRAGADLPAAADQPPPPAIVGQTVPAGSGALPLMDPTGAPVASAPLSPVAGEQVMQQVVQSLKLQWKDGIGEARLQLRPDALGTVSVTLRVEGGAVTAIVRAESAQVQEWVLQHQQTLRQHMEAAGLHLDELVVSPDDQRQPQQDRQDSAPDQRRRARVAARADDAGSADRPRFEQLL